MLPAPTEQPLPPGGEVIGTAPPGSRLAVETASGDLSRIVYGQAGIDINLWGSGGSYHLYDEATDTTTELPFPRRNPHTAVGISRDGTTLVVSTPDPSLQVGPTARNCRDFNGTLQPLTPTYCSELYLYDLETGALTQLTGLDGSSALHNALPQVADDGSSVEYRVGALIPQTGADLARMDLATREIEDLGPVSCCRTEWDRGDTSIVWQYPTLSSTDTASGITTQFSIPSGADLVSSAGNGRWIVLATGADTLYPTHHLVDTDDGSVRVIPGSWVDDDAQRFVETQDNVAPTGAGRVVLAPLQP